MSEEYTDQPDHIEPAEFGRTPTGYRARQAAKEFAAPIGEGAAHAADEPPDEPERRKLPNSTVRGVAAYCATEPPRYADTDALDDLPDSFDVRHGPSAGTVRALTRQLEEARTEVEHLKGIVSGSSDTGAGSCAAEESHRRTPPPDLTNAACDEWAARAKEALAERDAARQAAAIAADYIDGLEASPAPDLAGLMRRMGEAAEYYDPGGPSPPMACHWIAALLREAAGAIERPGGTARPGASDFQSRVRSWVVACFGDGVADDKPERCHRFIEEALELVQSLGTTRAECDQLVGYVYDRPAGDPVQEVGGAMTTLAALCSAVGIGMEDAAERELARVWTKIEKIRAKQAAKPKNSPLPEHAAGALSSRPDRKALARQISRIIRDGQGHSIHDTANAIVAAINLSPAPPIDREAIGRPCPVPAAVVEVQEDDPGEFHLFENAADAERFVDGEEPGEERLITYVRDWVWHPATQADATEETPAARVLYRNHRGETAVRTIVPLAVRWGNSEWHPEPQWLLDCHDRDRGVDRSFAVRGIITWDVDRPDAAKEATP